MNRLDCAAVRNSVARGRNFNHTSVLDVSGAVFDVSRGTVALNGTWNSESCKLCISVARCASIFMFCLTSNTHYGLRGCDVFNLVDMHRWRPRPMGPAEG